jgi:type II secretory pathway pseudopilin PulG
MSSQSGFTLIEVLASGIISTVIAGAILSIVYLTNNQIQDGTANLRLEERQRVASEQIQRSARFARGGMMASENLVTVKAQDAGGSPPSGNLQEIIFFDDNWCLVAGYKVGSNYLMEAFPASCTALADYKALTIGDDTVYLDPAQSYFRYFNNRKSIISNLKLTLQTAAGTYSRPNDSEFVLCRNKAWP